MKLVLPFHSYSLRAKQVASRKLVNCHAEQVPLPGKAPITLNRSAGVEDWVTLATSPLRGSIVHGGVLHAVAGNKLYSITETGAVTAIGPIIGSGRVKMATNGLQLVIVTPPHGYILDDGTLAQITDPDFTVRGAADVACLDSFMIYVEPDSGRAFASEFLDAGNIDPLDFATAEGAPDNLVAILVDHRQIFLFGTDTVELWYNSGSAGFPFLREQNGFIEVGCGAADSPCKADNTVYWLDDKRIFRKLNDMTPQRVSTFAIEQRWADYDRVDDAYSLSYVQDGHTFVCLTFPSAGESWEFDIATGEWHDRGSRGMDGNYVQWRVATQSWCYGANIVGDSKSGRLGKLNANVYTEWGEIHRMEWTYPNVYGEGRRAFHKRLEIVFESGVGLTVGQGSDPQAMLYVSDDGGVTFDALPSRSLGRIGQYRWHAVWNRLGYSDDRVYKCAVSDPVPVSVVDTQLEVEGGRL